MGLFDKIKRNDEEVELTPPSGSEERLRADDQAASAEAEDDEPFLLPGMQPSGDVEDDDGGRDRTGPGTSRSRDRRRDTAEDGKMQRIIDQNERIIELLEDIAGGDESDADSIWG